MPQVSYSGSHIKPVRSAPHVLGSQFNLEIQGSHVTLEDFAIAHVQHVYHTPVLLATGIGS